MIITFINFLAYNFLEMIWNVVSGKGYVDTKEVNENIKELNTAVNKFVKPFERLE